MLRLSRQPHLYPIRDRFRKLARLFRRIPEPLECRPLWPAIAIVSLCLLLTACPSQLAPNPVSSPNSEVTMQLLSPVFRDQGPIPAKYTCDGQDLSPPLRWDDVPASTQSFALICDDPDAPRRTFVHWVLFNLPADRRSLPEDIPSDRTLSTGGIQGKNDFGNLGYGGPCPPSGSHRYFFKLYALDRPLDLQPGATKSQVTAAMQGHILAESELMGYYQRSR